MISKKLVLISIGSLLISIATISFMGQKAAITVSKNTVLAATPLILVGEYGQEGVFLGLPSRKERNELSDLLGQNPQLTEERNVHRKVYKAKLISFDKLQKKQSSKAFSQYEVKFKDKVTAQEHTLDLLSFESKDGIIFVAEPGSETPHLIPKPTDISQQLFQHDQNLYILDTKTLQVKAIGDEQAQYTTKQKIKDLPDLGIEHGRILHWIQQPNWSPDGNTIAFLSNRNRIESNHIEVWIHDLITNQELKVYHRENTTPHILGWTADNKILINESKHTGGGGVLVAIDPKTGLRQEFISGDFVGQSDDRQTVLYVKRNSRHGELYALNLSNGTSQLLYKTPIEESLSIGQIDFSKDSTRFAIGLLNKKTGVESFLVYNLQTKNTKRLELPQGKRFYGRMTVKWLGDELAVPVESRNLNLQYSEAETLLMSTF
ncbi:MULTISPECIES: TolB family protein [Nostocales]|uniref:Uncharacterized protein n=3 Tax=Nostocales TaxID=1161 RepID=A0A0C1N6V2_9CYAN|nr:PD40 domain-containing protein [Tolypothrix bouteillei]KAF3886393.1 hypothetical protein DA73_0400013580 [Tolypothrix bouteillei VB521301]